MENKKLELKAYDSLPLYYRGIVKDVEIYPKHTKFKKEGGKAS